MKKGTGLNPPKVRKSALSSGIQSSKQQQNQSGLGGLSISGQSTGSKQSQPSQQKTQAKKQSQVLKGSTTSNNKTNNKNTTNTAKSGTKAPTLQSNNKKPVVNKQDKLIIDQKSNKQQQQQNNSKNDLLNQDEQKIQQQQEQEQQQKKKEEEVKEQKEEVKEQQQQQVVEEEEEEEKIGKVILRYNHYKEEFQIKNGKLSKIDIDEQWYLSGVFQGNFQMNLKDDETKEVITSPGLFFNNMKEGKIYWLSIIEDEEAENKVERKTYKAQEQQEQSGIQGQNRKVNDITNQLKGLSNQELLEKGEKYKQLIEARDLEDCLYS